MLPVTAKEVDTLCDYLTQVRGLGTDSRSQELARSCRRSESRGVDERRLDCVQQSIGRATKGAFDVESCMRQGQSFDQAMQDKRDFDRFEKIDSLSEYSALSRRHISQGDRLKLVAEIARRMHGLCARSQPDFSSRGLWVSALEDYRQAGPAGACADHATRAEQAILEIDRADERSALIAATSWRQLDAFLEAYAQRDVADLLPTARNRRDQARSDEISAMRAMNLDALEIFWRKASDITPELRGLARQRLLEESLAERSFAGGLRAFRVTGELSHVIAHQSLARTTDERRRLEEIAVAHTATPGRFFRVGVTASHGAPVRNETAHAGLFALYTMTGAIPIQGTVTVGRAPDAPGQLLHGEYRVHLEVTLWTRQTSERASSILGNSDSVSDRSMTRKVSVLVGPPTMFGVASFDFGEVAAVAVKRGSAGGRDLDWIAEDPVVQATIVGVDVIAGDRK